MGYMENKKAPFETYREEYKDRRVDRLSHGYGRTHAAPRDLI